MGRWFAVPVLTLHAQVEGSAVVVPFLGPSSQVEAGVRTIRVGHRDLGDLHTVNYVPTARYVVVGVQRFACLSLSQGIAHGVQLGFLLIATST